jgi:hypothetical protein
MCSNIYNIASSIGVVAMSNFNDFSFFLNQVSRDSESQLALEDTMVRYASTKVLEYKGGLWQSFKVGDSYIAIPPAMESYSVDSIGYEETAKFGSGDLARIACGFSISYLVLNWVGNHFFSIDLKKLAVEMFDLQEKIYNNIYDSELELTEEMKRAIFLVTD